MPNTPTPARPALDAMAEEIERLEKLATPGPWALSYTELHGKRYGLNGIVPADPAALQQISGSGGAKSFTRYVIEPDMMHDNIENECALVVYLRNNAPAISAALRSLADMRGALSELLVAIDDTDHDHSNVENEPCPVCCCTIQARAALARSAP